MSQVSSSMRTVNSRKTLGRRLCSVVKGPKIKKANPLGIHSLNRYLEARMQRDVVRPAKVLKELSGRAGHSLRGPENQVVHCHDESKG